MNDDELVARQIVIFGRKIRHQRNLYVRTLDLTSEQADAIRFFGDHAGKTIADFSGRQEITHQTARVVVQRLVQKGLLVLTPNPADGRAKLVSLTAAGQVKHTALKHHVWQTSQKLFANFTPAEQQTFLTLLRRADENLERN